MSGMLSCRGSVFPKAMVWAVPCSVIAGLLHWFLHGDGNGNAKEVVGIDSTAAGVYGGFTFILGFLVVFRSQQAYNRWWEGGTLLRQLRGEWFNAFSSLMAFSNAAPEKRADVMKFQQQLSRLFSLLHGCALCQVSHMSSNQFEMLNLEGFGAESLEFLQSCPDKCEIALQWIQRLIVESEQQTLLKIAPPILSRVFNELGNGIVNLNNATKIKDFLIPFPLAQMIMVMLCFHSLFTPLVCAATVNTSLWASLLSFVVIFSYWSVLYIALELEMPFGDDENDLPLQDMAMDLNLSLQAMMQPLASKVPEYVYKPEVDDLSTVMVDLDANICLLAAPRTYAESDRGLKRGSVRRTFTSFCSSEDVRSSRNMVAATPAVEVGVAGDHEAPSKLEQDPAVAVGKVPAPFGIPAQPTKGIETQQQPEDARGQIAEQHSKSEIASGLSQLQSSQAEIVHMASISDADGAPGTQSSSGCEIDLLPSSVPSN